jgi:stage II sporulation protein D
MRNLLLWFLFLLAAENQFAQSVKISIFNSQKINSFTLDIKQGEYDLKSGNTALGEYKKGGIFFISMVGNQLELRDRQNLIGKFDHIEFSNTAGEGVMILKPINPMMDGVDYDDDFIIKAGNNRIQIYNKLDMEKYIAAVIEAEGGNHAPLEYYKAQAVLVRTYTIKNMFKHAEEDFNLCDEVHCQAYKGRSSQNPEILEATRLTAGTVLIDRDSILVMSPFHSNCGGETSAAGLVWQKDLPYLQPVKDPFCTSSTHANWSAKISRDKWISFLNTLPDKRPDNGNANYSFSTIHRTKTVHVNGMDLSLRAIREYFNLKSNFFSLQDNGGELVFTGHGSGHGAGMCQEGAMEMARVGYTWPDIIHFYFQNIVFTDYREMELHRY